MDYTHVFEISASGMDFQKQRLDAIAANVANAYTTRSSSGSLYQPLEVIAVAPETFGTGLDPTRLNGVAAVEVVAKNLPPRLVYDPGHPDADGDGYVAYPHVDPIDAMTSLITATRAYEANARVLDAAKNMALKALELGD